MAKTSAEVTLKALRELFLVPVEQAAEAGVNAIVDEVRQEAYDELSLREIANWPVEATPDGVAGPFARYVAAMAASRVSGIDEENIKKLDRNTEYRNVVAAAGRKWSGQPTQVDGF